MFDIIIIIMFPEQSSAAVKFHKPVIAVLLNKYTVRPLPLSIKKIVKC